MPLHFKDDLKKYWQKLLSIKFIFLTKSDNTTENCHKSIYNCWQGNSGNPILTSPEQKPF